MTKVLTIDFDIMFWKSLPLYNNLVPQENWDTLMAKYSLLKHIEFDSEIYEQLTQLILRQTKHLKKENIHFITSHNRVLQYLPMNDTIKLTNIDHHHDVQYNENENSEILHCGNWVKYAHENGYCITQYNWIRNSNSIDCFLDSHKFITCEEPINGADLTMTDYNMLIICLSPPWVPPQYRPLYTAWIDMLNRIYNTTFVVDD